MPGGEGASYFVSLVVVVYSVNENCQNRNEDQEYNYTE